MAKGQPLQFDLDEDDLKLFTEEADEQLELLDTALVQLEGEPDAELVQQIFRAAHTLKGSSATIGHKRMASLTHAMESVLDAVRQNRLSPDSDVVDVLLVALDALRVLAAEVTTRVHSGTEPAAIEARLKDILDGNDGGAAVSLTATARPASMPPAVADTLLAELNAGNQAFHVHVTIDASCELPGIRCYQVLQEIEAIGAVPWTAPDRDAIEAGNGEHSLTMAVTGLIEESHVRTALDAVSDLGPVVVALLSVDELAAATPVTPLGSVPGERPRLRVVEPEAAAPASEAKAGKKASQSVRIDVERLDGLMNLVGELVIDRTRLQQIREAANPVLKDANLQELLQNFEETTSHLTRITDELQEEIMRSRMLPVRSVLSRLPRLVRDVSAKCGKKVELIMSGEETELDRSVIEEISDPLVHILRNAIDHGLESPEERRAAGKPETGTVTVTAWNQETYIYLSVKDDGKGIDTATLRNKAVEKGLIARDVADAASDEAAVQFIFLPGLSTAKTLSDVSGRGVGMDIVRTNIERVNGNVSVRSEPGKGSEFIIQLPLTLATTKALMVMAQQTVYAMPLVSVTEALLEREADIHSVNGNRTLRLRGKLFPLIDLAQALGDGPSVEPEGERFVVAARHGSRQVGFLVDRLLGEQDVVVKSLGDLIGNRKGLTGATILGDGTLGLIIDMPSLISEQALFAA
ncbi:MAG: chemotaxis protein CheA [Dehalococcoidia bacterium]|nr:chemotaxis protein CheA [Dehalococcoidia bacterium]